MSELLGRIDQALAQIKKRRNIPASEVVDHLLDIRELATQEAPV